MISPERMDISRKERAEEERLLKKYGLAISQMKVLPSLKIA